MNQLLKELQKLKSEPKTQGNNEPKSRRRRTDQRLRIDKFSPPQRARKPLHRYGLFGQVERVSVPAMLWDACGCRDGVRDSSAACFKSGITCSIKHERLSRTSSARVRPTALPRSPHRMAPARAVHEAVADGLGAAHDEVDRMAAKIRGILGLWTRCRYLAFALEPPPDRSQGDLRAIERGCVIRADEHRAVGGDQPRTTGRAVGGGVLPVLLGGSQVREKHVEVERPGDPHDPTLFTAIQERAARSVGGIGIGRCDGTE